MKHILIVEDDPNAAFILQRQLNKLGILTSVTTNLFYILSKVKEGMVDAITLDLQLPEIPGHEIIKHVRVEHPHIPIIVITAQASEETRVKYLELGASYFLTKPYYPADLNRIIKNLLLEK